MGRFGSHRRAAAEDVVSLLSQGLGDLADHPSLHPSQTCRQQTLPVRLFRESLHKPFPIAGLSPSQLPAGGSTLPAPPAMCPALPAPASVPSPASPQPGSSQHPSPVRALQAPVSSRADRAGPAPALFVISRELNHFCALFTRSFAGWRKSKHRPFVHQLPLP